MRIRRENAGTAIAARQSADKFRLIPHVRNRNSNPRYHRFSAIENCTPVGQIAPRSRKSAHANQVFRIACRDRPDAFSGKALATGLLRLETEAAGSFENRRRWIGCVPGYDDPISRKTWFVTGDAGGPACLKVRIRRNAGAIEVQPPFAHSSARLVYEGDDTDRVRGYRRRVRDRVD
jgi:hypothetical protein